ncbi:SDR family NAD(P)-dependent oxidoreductase [Anaplasma phagocytophilum str. Norway variant1]|uniref:SDR family NAD(P)-dependent oxidoreductase n=1 Tax=Anaplasma phagocytophilum str. Norway variant1 TaxID=1392506 RepID=A0A7H9DXP8_ANAPH|nr:SDR family NAD(P)-dependent oxidoreductase [Anaplasma phagocytophilum]QLL66372.1 SDR family NAD(P)-dependent oxidoreductase [Anaplasma phagocytophilum str. Norway variant1]
MSRGHERKKAVLITGAANRIGRAIAVFLAARHGYDIAVHYNTSYEKALELQAAIREVYGKKCELFQADLRNFSALEALMKDVFAVLPHCNVLINNASVFYTDCLKECNIRDFEENFDIHVKSPVFLTQYFSKGCVHGGKVINIADARVTRTSTKYFSYLLTKKSLIDFTELAATELAPNICVNAICPTKVPDNAIDNIEALNNIEAHPQLLELLKLVELLVDLDGNRTGEIHFMNS